MQDGGGSDRDFYWDWAKHEEMLLANRGSFFLVGAAMLFAGVASLRVSGRPAAVTGAVVFCGLGIFVTVVWALVYLLHHLNTRLPPEE